MKKGLRLAKTHGLQLDPHSNSRPDEEGIKTLLRRGMPHPRSIPTADLMKKGLRRGAGCSAAGSLHSNSRPDEEGIKTSSDVGLLGQLQFQQQT